MTRLRMLALGLVAAFAALLALAGPAFAHVTVSAPGAARGGSDQQITFRVPVEERVDTVGLTIRLPADTPIASVLVDRMPGWTHTQKTSPLAKPVKSDDGDITSAVSQITWTASPGQGLTPGEYGAFTIIAGQLPDAASITFKALQKYRDGTVVSWIETAAPGSKIEPEHPAPVLDLAPTRQSGTGHLTATSKPTKAPSNTGPVVLSIIALVIAAGALGLVVVSRARGRGDA